MTNLNYLYNSSDAQKLFGKNYFVDKTSGFTIVKHGTILPTKDNSALGGIVDGDGQYIKNSFLHYGLGKPYTPPHSDVQYSSESVVYAGLFYSVWGHGLTDNLRYLWFLTSDAFKQRFHDLPVVYISWWKGAAGKENFIKLLKIMGIDINLMRLVDKPTQFENIILPDESFYCTETTEREFTAEYREMIERVRSFALKNRTPSAKKIYYLYGRKQYGEERLAEYFRSKGYEIIRPETLTLEEQLNVLINCESFAATLGSVSHNLIFLRDNTEVILIPRHGNYFTFYHAALDQVHPLKITYVDTTLSIYSKRHGPSCYIISRQLKELFGDKFDGYAEDDFKIFMQYVKFCTERGLVLNSRVTEYCRDVLKDFLPQLKRHEDLTAICNLPPDLNQFQSSGYQTHIHKKGWTPWIGAGQISNNINRLFDIQAIKINFPDHKIFYSVYYSDAEGWSEEVTDGQTAGTIGKHKSIYGMKIRLDEAGTSKFDVIYRMHKFDGEWTPWAKNGEVIYSHGQKLNAIQIKLEPKI